MRGALKGVAAEGEQLGQRSRMEEELDTSNYRLKIILDSLAQGVAQYDRGGQLQATNASARKVLPQASLEELERISVNEEGEPWPPGAHPVTRALKEGHPSTDLVMGILQEGGHPVWVSLNATPLLYHSRDPWGVVVSFTDITEQRRMREALRLSELALRDMERLNAKGQMAAYIAHEINNPLAGIKNAFLLLERAVPGDHPHRSYVPLINREIDRISSIIRTMYHVYRPDPGSTRKVVIEEVFFDLESLLASKGRAHATRLAFDSSGLSEEGTVNEGFFRQVLFNLIQNALEASPKGGVVTVVALSEAGTLEVSVGDEGAGIPPVIAERIFQPGFTTKVDRDMSGLGLGLATCRSLVETMGGTLAFQNRPSGSGTVFTVKVPFGKHQGNP